MRFTHLNALLAALPLASAAATDYGRPGYRNGGPYRGNEGKTHEGVGYEYDKSQYGKLQGFRIYCEPIVAITKRAPTKTYFTEYDFSERDSPKIAALLINTDKDKAEIFTLDDNDHLSFTSNAVGKPCIFAYYDSKVLAPGEGQAVFFSTDNVIDDDGELLYLRWEVDYEAKTLRLINPLTEGDVHAQACAGEGSDSTYDLFISTTPADADCVDIELCIETVRED